jgi:hypothetical protein
VESKNMLKRLRSAILLLWAASLCLPQAHAQIGKVIVWGVDTNTPEWNRALGVSATRSGCSSVPSACIHSAKETAHKYGVKVFISIPLTADSPARAVEYSQLSSSIPALVEVGTDDFVSAYRKLSSTYLGDPTSIVEQTIDNLKSINPNLKWGVTLYEDELANPILQDTRLPAAVRAKFDYIHLYPHYRQNGLDYDKYIPDVKRLFPNARIIAGAYAYDRRQYLPCAQKAREACSTDQELDLFKKTIAIQRGLFKNGSLDWIEFYPGYFGKEGSWEGWSDSRYCKPGDRDTCIQITKQLHAAAIRELGGQAPGR